MALILRSNSVAGRSIGNIHGLVGPTDFSAMFDFEKNLYSADGQAMGFSDVIQFSRTSKAGYTDYSGAERVAEVNEPRMHRLGTGRGGLLLAPATDNLLSNPSSPATQTASVPKSAASWTYVFLKVWGSGSAELSTGEPIMASSPSVVATEGTPVSVVFDTGSGSAPVTITVSGSITRFELTRYNSNRWGASVNPALPVGVSSVADDLAEIMPSLIPSILTNQQGTVVVAYSREPRLSPTYGSLTGPRVSVLDGSNPRGGLYAAHTSITALRATGYNAGESSPALTFNQAAADANNTTVAISWDNYGEEVMLANNGLVSTTPNSFVLPEINRCTFAADIPAVGLTPNAVLTHAVTYLRALSVAELQEVTRSWT